MDFPQSIVKANELLEHLDKHPDDGTEGQFSEFMSNELSARGFFVALLTGNWQRLDLTQPALIAAMTEHAAVVDSLLARNLVMSAATAYVHDKNGDEQNCKASQTVTARTAMLIEAMNLQSTWMTLKQMHDSLLGDSQEFGEFLKRVDYDDEQKVAAIAAVDEALSRKP